MVQCLWISSPNGISSKSTMETVIRREEQSCFSLQVRVHSCTFSIKCLWLQIRMWPCLQNGNTVAADGVWLEYRASWYSFQ